MFVTLRYFDDEVAMNFVTLANAAEDIETARTTMNGMITDLNTSLDAKTSTWVGEADTSYQNAKNDWNGAREQIEIQLDRIKAAVEDARADMIDREGRIADGFRR